MDFSWSTFNHVRSFPWPTTGSHHKSSKMRHRRKVLVVWNSCFRGMWPEAMGQRSPEVTGSITEQTTHKGRETRHLGEWQWARETETRPLEPTIWAPGVFDLLNQALWSKHCLFRGKMFICECLHVPCNLLICFFSFTEEPCQLQLVSWKYEGYDPDSAASIKTNHISKSKLDLT